MTTETTPTVEQLQASLEEQRAALKAAEESQVAQGPALYKAGDYDGLAKLNAPVQAARTAIERTEKRIADATKESRWSAFEAERSPVQEVLDNMVADKPYAPVLNVKGRILIDTVSEQDGDATVQVRRAMVTLRHTLATIDLDAYEEQIASTIDVAKWDAAGIDDVSITITGIGTADFKLAISPTASLNQAGKATSTEGARAGALEYSFNGEWLSTKAFLMALESTGHDFVTKNAAGFERALRGDGNAMSNLGKRAAKATSTESRTKPTA